MGRVILAYSHENFVPPDLLAFEHRRKPVFCRRGFWGERSGCEAAALRTGPELTIQWIDCLVAGEGEGRTVTKPGSA
jgi:hypothetical protein